MNIVFEKVFRDRCIYGMLPTKREVEPLGYRRVAVVASEPQNTETSLVDACTAKVEETKRIVDYTK